MALGLQAKYYIVKSCFQIWILLHVYKYEENVIKMHFKNILCLCVICWPCISFSLYFIWKKKSDKFVIPNLSSFSMSVISLFEELHRISILQKTDMLVDKVCKHNVYIPLMKISLRNQKLKIRLRQQDLIFKYSSGTESWIRWIFSIWYKKNEIMIETDNFRILRCL